MMPLTMANPAEESTILKITGKDEVQQHLAEIGFVVGATVNVVSEMAGNVIVTDIGKYALKEKVQPWGRL